MSRIRNSPTAGPGVWGGQAHGRSSTASRFAAHLVAPVKGAGFSVALAGLLLLVLLSGARVSAAQAHAGTGQTHARSDPRPGYLGVSLLDLDPDTAAHLHLKDTHGALIVTIDRDAPAASAGLRSRDVIIEAGGQRIDNVDGLRRKLHETSAGSTIALRISRDGVEQALSVQLGDQAEIAARAWEMHFNTPDSSGADAELPNVPETNFVPPSGKGPGSAFLATSP